MKFYPPNKSIWVAGLLFGIAGLIGQFWSVGFLTEHSTTLLMVGWLEMAISPFFPKKE